MLSSIEAGRRDGVGCGEIEDRIRHIDDVIRAGTRETDGLIRHANRGRAGAEAARLECGVEPDGIARGNGRAVEIRRDR